MKYTLEQWSDIARVFWDITPLGDPERFAVDLEARLHDRLICTEVRFTGQEFKHDPAHIKGVDHNFLLYERYFVGRSRGLVAECPVHIDQGTIHLVDMSRRCRKLSNDVVTAGVCIPHDLVGYDPVRDPAYLSVSLASPQGRMVDLAHGSFRAALARNQADVAELADTFLTLVWMLMVKGSDTPSTERQDLDRRPLLRTFITRNLEDPRLSPDHICRQLGLSRTSLYREFREDGGVLRFITDRRLDRCFADLMATPASRGAVRQVAERWGFHHAGNFHRLFRERFGMSPSDYLDRNGLPAASGQGNTFHPIMDWMRAG